MNKLFHNSVLQCVLALINYENRRESMQKYIVNSPELTDFVNVIKLLAHPIRFSIALSLKDNGVLNVSKIQESLDLTQSTVSQHISKLREAGIVSAERDGTKIFYSLTSDTAKLVLDAYSQYK